MNVNRPAVTIRRTAQGTWMQTLSGWQLIYQGHPCYDLKESK